MEYFRYRDERFGPQLAQSAITFIASRRVISLVRSRARLLAAAIDFAAPDFALFSRPEESNNKRNSFPFRALKSSNKEAARSTKTKAARKSALIYLYAPASVGVLNALLASDTVKVSAINCDARPTPTTTTTSEQLAPRRALV